MRFHHYFFQLFLLFLPTQLSYHFWPTFSFVNGLRIDYLSPTLYFTDLLFLVFITSWLLSKKKIIKFSRPVLLIAILISINIWLSLSPISSLLHWLRVFQAFLLYLYIRDNKFIPLQIIKPLSLGIIITLLLSLAQIAIGRNVGGVFYWLGERPLSIYQPGVSLMSLSGASHLRPYATFPHPNVLAGYAGLFFLFSLPYLHLKNAFHKITLVAALALVVVSFSQAAWLALAIALVSMKVKVHSVKLLLIVFTVLSLLLPMLTINSELLSLSILQRLELAHIAGRVISTSPILGVGLGQFIRTIPQYTSQTIWWLQPVHNLALLIFVEMGIAGLVITFLSCLKYLQRLPKHAFPLIIFILITGLVDHYWLTIHQTLLLIPIVFGTIKTNDFIHK